MDDCPHLPGEIAPQAFRKGGMLQHQSALQVLGTVKPAGQPEVAPKISAGPVEQLEDAAFLRYHKCLLYHWRIKEQIGGLVRLL